MYAQHPVNGGFGWVVYVALECLSVGLVSYFEWYDQAVFHRNFPCTSREFHGGTSTKRSGARFGGFPFSAFRWIVVV